MNETTQDQKRIKIAEADGWKRDGDDGWISPSGVYHQEMHRFTDKYGDPLPPRYFNDRNACIEVILKMNPIKRQDFIHALVMVVAPSSQWHDMHIPELFNCITATPGQLCEAIGSTLNLW